MDGNIHDDSAIWRLRTEYEKLITTEMKIAGYVVRLDIDPDFTIKYNSTQEIFEFKISLYGTYVGKKKAEWIVGIDGTTVIYTQPNKSSEFSQEQASQLNQK